MNPEDFAKGFEMGAWVARSNLEFDGYEPQFSYSNTDWQRGFDMGKASQAYGIALDMYGESR